MEKRKKSAIIAVIAGIIGSFMSMGVVYAYESPQITQNVSFDVAMEGVTNESFYEGGNFRYDRNLF